MTAWLHRLLARQFTRPSGLLGRLVIAPWLNRMSREDNRLLLDRLDLKPGYDVLELGFGGGDLLAMAHQAGAGTLYGVDPSADMTRRAARRFARQRNIKLLQDEAGHIPLAAAAVDRAASLHNIYFWEDPAQAFNEIARVLRPGGILMVGFEPAQQMRQWPGHEYGFRLWQADEAAGMMTAAGFEEVRSETIEKSVDVVFVSGRKPAKR